MKRAYTKYTKIDENSIASSIRPIFKDNFRMKLRIILTLTLLINFAIYGNSQQMIFVLGQITSVENGLPVDQKEVTLELDNGVAVVVITNQNGAYNSEFLIQANDSVSFLTVSVTDCNLQVQQQVFPTGNQTQFQADFEICTQTATCEAAFIAGPMPANQQLIGFDNLSFPVSYSTYWYWDFGDGSNSNDFEPVHEYTQAGIYNVCLTMVDSMLACTSIFCLEVWVNLPSSDCEALYSFDVQGNTISFTDMSTGFPDAWLWNFGDGTASSEQNPIHAWNIPGAYQVCLTIYNDSIQCESTFCDIVTLGDTLPDCQADYSYVQVQGLTYAFTNLSTGQPDQVIWDFGDGTPFSYETNPVHTWEQAGIYHVCLAIISNLTGCQDVMCLYITVGVTIPFCQADFTYRLDSIPGNVNHYWFVDESQGIDISSWYWDFGDGNYYYERFPEHTYENGGTYEVCLTIFTWYGPFGECSSTKCKMINTPAYHNLGGQVFAGNFPINNPDFTGDTAMVRLIKKSGNHLTEVAKANFWEYGYFFFIDVLDGEYVVQADLTPESNAYTSFMPAYSGDVPYWQQAQSFSLSGGDVYDADVVMSALPPLENGPGLIGGHLDCMDNSPVDLAERIVYLIRDGNIVSLSHTDTVGNFVFSGVPLGAYTLRVEIAGKYSDVLAVNLTEFDNQAMLLQLNISSSNVYGTDDTDSFVNAVNLFPNPATGNINLRFNLDRQTKLVSEVYTATGIICLSETHFCPNGENKLTLNLASLKPGFYLIALKSAQGAILLTKKFSKI